MPGLRPRCLAHVPPALWRSGHTSAVEVAAYVHALVPRVRRVVHFTIVREPIARFASEFAQWKDRSHWLQDAHSAALRARWANITLEGYARHADCPAHNRMAWMLGAPQPPNDDSTRPSPSDFAPFWRAHYGGADDYVARLNEDEGVLTRAKSFLDSALAVLL